MKFLASASYILLGFLLLTGCDSFNIHNPTLHDQVPDSVKAQPLVVETAPPVPPSTPYPRLGDVPTKPKDFSPKPVYEHYMDEMEYDRTQAQEEKKQIDQEATPVSPSTPVLSAPQSSQGNILAPPQFPKE
jgi:hypothetical protein